MTPHVTFSISSVGCSIFHPILAIIYEHKIINRIHFYNKLMLDQKKHHGSPAKLEALKIDS